MPLLPSGYQALTAAEFLDIIRSEFESDTGYTPDWSADEFLGNITANMALRLDEISQGVQSLADSWDINNATDVSLDKLVALVGITRNEATFSTAEVSLGGTAAVVVPAGSVVENSSTGTRWVTLTDATLPDVVTAEAVDSGPVTADVGEIDTIVTSIFGWDTVTNAASASVGFPRETDAQLRTRRRSAMQAGSSGTLNSLRSAAADLEFVDAATAIENDSNVAATVDGIAMTPHSWAIVVYPSTLTTAEEIELAEALYNVAPAGIESIGTESQTVTGADGHLKTVKFSYASDLTVNVSVTTSLTGISLAEAEAEIDDLLTTYFAGLQVGDDVFLLQLCALIATVSGIDGATFLLNGVGADVAVTASERAVLGTVTVL